MACYVLIRLPLFSISHCVLELEKTKKAMREAVLSQYFRRSQTRRYDQRNEEFFKVLLKL